ncbi:MAG: hypothetical protein MUO76_00175, partial [Anaerolineaceae bacterium]|nr:hypothetical protein [Anaerolineaceae bacterium]
YLQAWTFFSISAASMLVWVFPAVISKWSTFWRNSWQIIFICLISSAFLFPIMGGLGKIQDRMSNEAPHTFDGMTYMAYSKYNDNGVEMELRDDYEAILWMQDNIQGSPVIVEANTPEYRWGSRFTIYTGLPGVVGWNWHQRQQRAVTESTWVWDRVDAIKDFYNSIEKGSTRSFLRKFDVEYIILGQLEYANYQEHGLAKFSEWEGELWAEVYNQGQTIIYQVIK